VVEGEGGVEGVDLVLFYIAVVVVAIAIKVALRVCWFWHFSEVNG
jgi:hypothetical protein